MRTPSVEMMLIESAMKQDQLKPGDQVHHGYRHHSWKAEFKGYTDHHDPYSETPKFQTMKDVHAHYGTKNNKELEAHPEGQKVRAIWKEHPSEGGNHYHTYLYNGKWSVGSSADKQTLHKIQEGKETMNTVKSFAQKLADRMSQATLPPIGDPAAIAKAVTAKEMEGAGAVNNTGGTQFHPQKKPGPTGNPSETVNAITDKNDKEGYTASTKKVDTSLAQGK